MEKTKRRLGDRKDGQLIRELDAMHFVMGVVYPSRPDNEAFISERIDLEPIKEYIAKKNAEGDDFKYTFFHVVVTALLKTIQLRPKLNRFIKNENYYQRNELSAAFTVKKEFTDASEEGMAFVRATPEDTMDSIHEKIRAQVKVHRSKGSAGSTDDAMNILNKFPRFLSKFALHVLRWLDKHGWVPRSLVEYDANYASVFLSNLGSIKLKCGYHHLSTWGTCSLFCIIGEKKWTPLYDENGFVKMRETLDLGLTIDERIADGYYYSKSIRLAKKLLENPELLDLPLGTEVEY